MAVAEHLLDDLDEWYALEHKLGDFDALRPERRTDLRQSGPMKRNDLVFDLLRPDAGQGCAHSRKLARSGVDHVDERDAGFVHLGQPNRTPDHLVVQASIVANQENVLESLHKFHPSPV